MLIYKKRGQKQTSLIIIQLKNFGLSEKPYDKYFTNIRKKNENATIIHILAETILNANIKKPSQRREGKLLFDKKNYSLK